MEAPHRLPFCARGGIVDFPFAPNRPRWQPLERTAPAFPFGVTPRLQSRRGALADSSEKRQAAESQIPPWRPVPVLSLRPHPTAAMKVAQQFSILCLLVSGANRRAPRL